MSPSGAERRARLARARLMLLFTPELCPPGRPPLEVLARALPHVDVVQVRIKETGQALAPARATLEWTERVLALRAEVAPRVLVLVNDRPDVARTLGERVDGVHLGADDAPPELARELLGAEALVGLSTHTAAEVVAAEDRPVDYLGFGPVHATATKGYAGGLGAEAAWIAARASSRPLFPIGGIDATNAGELTEVGRAAVSRALLAAEDPARAAEELLALLSGDA
ncbi:MAG TPA: thiamine phosphate synthase [Planctomycetota bacterium]